MMSDITGVMRAEDSVMTFVLRWSVEFAFLSVFFMLACCILRRTATIIPGLFSIDAKRHCN